MADHLRKYESMYVVRGVNANVLDLIAYLALR